MGLMRSLLVGLAIVASLVGACGGRKLESKSAVQAAIEGHLKQRSNVLMTNMTLQVEDVKFEGDKAEAHVTYRSKQTPELSVRIRYLLRRAGDHWEVESSSPVGGMGANPHGAAGPRGADERRPPSDAPAPQASH
jgi:hypothetical protein